MNTPKELHEAANKLDGIAQTYKSMWDLSKGTHRTVSEVQDTPDTIRKIELAATVLREKAEAMESTEQWFDEWFKTAYPVTMRVGETVIAQAAYLAGHAHATAQSAAKVALLAAEVRRMGTWFETDQYSNIEDTRPPAVTELLEKMEGTT